MEELQSLARNDVFILGAGFSKAVSELFPLAAELLGPIEDALNQDLTNGVRRKGGEGFEQWLSRLAEGQPYLSPDKNLERSAAFLRVSQKIGEVLTERENEALECHIPDWLAKLLFVWHVRNATVISFNYDNVVEAAVQSQLLPLCSGYGGSYWVRTHDVLNRLPPLPPQRMYEETRVDSIHGGIQPSPVDNYVEQPVPAEDTFRLLKLHGSISWYWVSDDTTGVTLQRWPDIGKFGDPMGDQRAKIARQLPGRVPFIAPPSSTKSKYLGNPVIRKLWQDAFQALQKADHIYFLGYSVPPQDLAAMGLIAEAVADRTPSPSITVVDKRSPKVIENLATLLLSSDNPDGQLSAEARQDRIHGQLITTYNVKEHGDDNAIEEFSHEYFHKLKSHAVDSLNEFALHLEQEVDQNEPETLLMHGELNVVPRPRADATLRLCTDHMAMRDHVSPTLVIPFDSCQWRPDGEGISKLMRELLLHKFTQLVVKYTDRAGKVHDFPVVNHRLELQPANMYGEGHYMLSLIIFGTQQPPLNYCPELATKLKAP